MIRHLVFLLIFALSGCATYRPIPNDLEHASFRVLTINNAKQEGQLVPEISHVVDAIENYRRTILMALRERANGYWNVSDSATGGAVAAIIGGLTDRTGLLNSGLVVTGLGLTTMTRYKQDQQIDFTLSALTRINCVYGRLFSITSDVVYWVRLSQDVAAQDALKGAPETAIRAIESIQTSYLTSLYSLKPTVPNKADLAEYFSRYAAAQNAATAFTTRSGGANKEQIDQAIKQTVTIAVDLEACVKL